MLGRLQDDGGKKVNPGVNKRARIASATVVDKDGRTRYLGRKKRGAPGVGSVDRGDLELAANEVMAALAGLELYESTAGHEMPRVQREDLRQAYVGRAFAAARATLEMCKRAGWTVPGLNDEDADEEIAATPRKGGR
jgi:hypothetical protein